MAEVYTVMQEDNQEQTQNGGVDWSDPSVPVGNSPPLPRWPLFVALTAWVAWLVFLVVMLTTRTASTVV